MRKIIAFLAIISVLFLLLCSCATTGEVVPDWVLGKHNPELASKYLLAVGSGWNREVAEKDARQNLASYFGTNINAQIYSGSTYYEKAGDVRTSQIYNTDLLIDVKVDDLVCIEEIETYVDPEGAFYALLGMNRIDSVVYYSSKLADLNREIAVEYASLENSTHNLENLILLADLRTKVSKATEISEMIGLIDRSRSIAVSIQESQLQRLRQAFIDDVSFSFELNGDAESIFPSVEKVITDNGFHISLEQTTNVIVLSLMLSDISGNSKNAFCGYDLSVEIKDSMTGKVLYSWEKQGREAMSTFEQAKAKVIYNLSKEIDKEFNAAFAENF